QSWFFEQAPVHPEHYNQAVLLEVGATALLRPAVERLLAHHGALRLRFHPPADGEGSWQQLQEGAVSGVFTQIDLQALPEERQRLALEAAASGLQASLDLSAGPLARVAFFMLGRGSERPGRLLIVLHHLVVDGVSWRILFQNLETTCRQLAGGEAVALPPERTSFRSWAGHLAEQARSPAVLAQLGYWREALQRSAPLPVDYEQGANDVASARDVAVSLTADETRALLQEVPRAYRTRINDVLLTALVQAFEPWTGQRRLLLELEGHGREEVLENADLSQTVGWFTTLFPVHLDLGGTTAPGEALQSVKEQLRAVPLHGLGYGLLRSRGEDGAGEELRRLPQPGVVFNYLGQLDAGLAESGFLRPADEPVGETRHPAQIRPYLLEVHGSVLEGRLRMGWTYSGNRHRRATIAALAERFLTSLRALVAHCLSPEAGGFTPSDFPLAKLDRARLARLTAGMHRQIEDIYPVSPTQQGLLFHTLHDPGSGVYVGQMCLSLDGRLDTAAFESAWRGVIQRHRILRTAFWWLGLERPLQAVHAQVPLPWEVHDWRQLPASERQAKLEAWLEEDRREGFDASVPPLLRLTLIRFGEESYRFIWSFHHLIMDGWSMGLVLQEFIALYKAFSRHRHIQLPASRPFRDYVAWLKRQDLRKAEVFWRGALRGVTGPTPLNVGGAPGRSNGSNGAGATHDRIEIRFGHLAAPLQALARTHQVTLNT
ncbi:MAG TPA: condensation domain-containing protein, partial [Thermoanaerobaculia bacterium]|nr:condensation domain-containing protein [Thermoanaerobaculia bacterium]